MSFHKWVTGAYCLALSLLQALSNLPPAVLCRSSRSPFFTLSTELTAFVQLKSNVLPTTGVLLISWSDVSVPASPHQNCQTNTKSISQTHLKHTKEVCIDILCFTNFINARITPEVPEVHRYVSIQLEIPLSCQKGKRVHWNWKKCTLRHSLLDVLSGK